MTLLIIILAFTAGYLAACTEDDDQPPFDP
jgi:hypothetical protein